MPSAALYARVSTARQLQKDLSVPDQLAQLRAWCKANGFTVVQEYVEGGATATDDKRPQFQQMVGDASAKPSPFDVVVVHSLSRFFRDSFQFAMYERLLNKSGVRVVSITQQTSDDPSGEMARKIFSIFDEYQSKENGKHTLRAMLENARRGFLNGSKPPYGYRAVVVEGQADLVRQKKRIDIDPVEAGCVRRIFELYIQGFSVLDVAEKLRQEGIKHRRSHWNRSLVHTVLANRAYVGEYIFNRKSNKNGLNPESEWIRFAVPPIIENELFEAVQAKKAGRSPSVVPARVSSSPTLLTGILRCAKCGAGMTMASGQGGKYKYYKCQTRVSKGKEYCDAPAIVMDKLDQIILTALAEQVFTPQRISVILRQLSRKLKSSQEGESEQLSMLANELAEVQKSIERLYHAVEQGVLPLDDTLKSRAENLQARKTAILEQVATKKTKSQVTDIEFDKQQIEAFGNALKSKLKEGDIRISKNYLRMFVDEIRLGGELLEISGKVTALANGLSKAKEATPDGVTSFVSNWLPDLDSNQGPAD